MLTKRIIPCLDVKGGRVVKGIRFKEHRDIGDPVELAAKYDAEGSISDLYGRAIAYFESEGHGLDAPRLIQLLIKTLIYDE